MIPLSGRPRHSRRVFILRLYGQHGLTFKFEFRSGLKSETHEFLRASMRNPLRLVSEATLFPTTTGA